MIPEMLWLKIPLHTLEISSMLHFLDLQDILHIEVYFKEQCLEKKNKKQKTSRVFLFYSNLFVFLG